MRFLALQVEISSEDSIGNLVFDYLFGYLRSSTSNLMDPRFSCVS